ncbi:MAG: hypothetical protein K0Q89_855 [Thermomicrobiales bacterium]|jgi:hypothetical protein|nr:hypothetical protein [Thermomicrobiales bacterium]
MRALILIVALCGCVSGGTTPDSAKPPQSCEVENDCFWSHCSFSSCVDGACVHEQIADGTTCLDPDVGYGECESSLCIAEQ